MTHSDLAPVAAGKSAAPDLSRVSEASSTVLASKSWVDKRPRTKTVDDGRWIHVPSLERTRRTGGFRA
jgi:hypothetical protein